MSAPDPDLPPPFRPHHTVAQRLVLGVNIVVVLACLAGAAGLVWAKGEADKRLQTPKVAVVTSVAVPTTIVPDSVYPIDSGQVNTTTGETFPPADPQAKNFLITGSDTNACTDPNSPWAGAADPARANIGMRSDTIMVMRVDPATNQAAILSFPRDLRVRIPGRGLNRINTAYVKDDYSVLAQTLYDNFGIVVDHYLQVDFCTFKRIVDAVGGVPVPFETPIRDRYVGIDIKQAGCHTFSGDEALAYVRSRHLKWIDENGKAHEDRASDFGRISRQQDFLRRVLQAALDRGLFDPAVARALITSLQTDVVTEEGFTFNDMLQFAGVLRHVDPTSIRTYQIEATEVIVQGQSMLNPLLKSANMKAILAIFQGTAPLAGAPDQVFTSTTLGGPATTGGATTTSEPNQNIKGDIIPPRDIICP